MALFHLAVWHSTCFQLHVAGSSTSTLDTRYTTPSLQKLGGFNDMATVVGLFDTSAQAQTAVEQLRSSGISPNAISVAMKSDDNTTAVTSTTVTDTDTGSGIVTGAVGGGVLGGLAGLLVGVGALAVPGMGPLVVAGPLATTLIGAGVGAAAGGLVGALVSAGVPEEEARLYETGVQRGGVLVTVRTPDGREQMVRDILNANGARDIRNDANTLYTDENYRHGQVYHEGVRDNAAGAATGGAGGAVAGGVIGAAVGGPIGAAGGAAIGGALGAAGGEKAEEKAKEDRTAYDTETDTTYHTDTP
jgi:hypothetical protein